MKNYSKQDVINLIKSECKKIGSQKKFAKHCGISQQYLSDIIKGNRGIGTKITRELKLTKID